MYDKILYLSDTRIFTKIFSTLRLQNNFLFVTPPSFLQMADSVNDLEDKADTVPLDKSQASDSSCLC